MKDSLRRPTPVQAEIDDLRAELSRLREENRALVDKLNNRPLFREAEQGGGAAGCLQPEDGTESDPRPPSERPARPASIFPDDPGAGFLAENSREEATLGENSRLFKELIEGTDGLVVRLDARGRVTYVNHRSLAILGCRPEECFERSALDFILPEDRGVVLAAFKSFFDSREPSIQYETRVAGLDGTVRILLWTINIQVDERGTIQGLFGIANDVTERKEMEKALAESESRFRQLADNTRDVFWIRDFRTREMLFLNKAFEDIWGRSRRDVMDNPAAFAEFVHPEDLPAVAEAYRRQAEELEWVNREYRVTRPDGAVRWVWVRNWPVNDEQGRPVRVVGVGQDITNRKQVETALIAAKEEAESANRAKSEFLANLSHELRTPMNAVMGLTDLVLESDLEQGQREALTNVRAAAARLLDVINMVIELSYIEAGRAKLSEQPFSLKETLRVVMDDFAAEARDTGLSLACRVDPGTPELVVGDFQRLSRILRILIGNALKFTEKGGVEVLVGPSTQADGTVKLRIEVKDSGIGVPAVRLGEIFRSFYQVDGSLTRRRGGLGLGLITARRLVELMAGEIGVDSREGRGSAFHIIVPLKLLEG
ncbi:MAG: PAS domain S-box protein [Pseudomonadota bacterium]